MVDWCLILCSWAKPLSSAKLAAWFSVSHLAIDSALHPPSNAWLLGIPMSLTTKLRHVQGTSKSVNLATHLTSRMLLMNPMIVGRIPPRTYQCWLCACSCILNYHQSASELPRFRWLIVSLPLIISCCSLTSFLILPIIGS